MRIKYLVAIVLIGFLGCSSSSVPNERLSGEFSVSATRKVRFTLGNLQYQVNTGTWNFAKNQSDIVGQNNYLNKNSNYNGNIDLFTPFDLKGNTFINSDKFRILRREEWEYLLKERENANSLFGMGYVNNQRGLFLLPDNWNFELPFYFGYAEYMGARGDYGYIYKNRFTLEEFSKYEDKGVVFLPFAGSKDITYSFPSDATLASMNIKNGNDFIEKENEICKFFTLLEEYYSEVYGYYIMIPDGLNKEDLNFFYSFLYNSPYLRIREKKVDFKHYDGVTEGSQGNLFLKKCACAVRLVQDVK